MYSSHIRKSINYIVLSGGLAIQYNEAKNNNVFDMFVRLKELLEDETIDKIKSKENRSEIESNACQVTSKPYVVYKKITDNERHHAFIATLLLPVGSTIVRPFTESWIDKRNGYMDLYREDVPFLDVRCELSNNMRVDQAIVVEVEAIDPTVKLPLEFRSVQESNFKYIIGQLVVTPLNTNPRVETTCGIHVVSTKDEAKKYLFL
jgi:hypothetical protein